MPDDRRTPAALKEHLRKHLALYIVCVALALMLSNLLWTVTEPRIPSDQTVLIYLVDRFYDPDALQDVADDMLARAGDDRLRSVSFQSIQYSDDTRDYTGRILLLTRLSTGEADAFLASAPGMQALAEMGALAPLDAYLAEGWLGRFGLAPFRTVIGEGGAEQTAGLRLDSVGALRDMGAFFNEGACLALSAHSDKPDETRQALEVMLEDLTGTSGREAARDD